MNMQIVPNPDGLSLEDGDKIGLRFIHELTLLGESFSADIFFMASGGEFLRDEIFVEILDDDSK